ncbi:hypothetical protein V3C99_014885, partial [Haemonchus contortus]
YSSFRWTACQLWAELHQADVCFILLGTW